MQGKEGKAKEIYLCFRFLYFQRLSQNVLALMSNFVLNNVFNARLLEMVTLFKTVGLHCRVDEHAHIPANLLTTP